MTVFLFSKPMFFEIPRHLNDRRIDSALLSILREKYPEEHALSRAFITRAIKDGRVLLNNKQVLPRVLVATHDILTIFPSVASENPIVKPSSPVIDLTKIFENEQILVIDKGAGVQMHQGGSHKGATVAWWIREHYPKLSFVGEDPLRPGIVHRLDRDTSGVVIIAKNNDVFHELKDAFQNREVEKIYVALVYGHLRVTQGEISASLFRTSGELKRRAIDTEKYSGILSGNTRTALTIYRVIARYKEYDLVELTPKTGRTHQLRVHLAFIGHPVVGDKLYSFKGIKRKNLLFPSRQMLHAAGISFVLFQKKYQFRSPFPSDFKQLLSDIDETRDPSYDSEALKRLFSVTQTASYKGDRF